MIYTSSHKNFETTIYKTYAISGNRGKDANYKGESYPALAPKLSFWEIWHNNVGKISEEENNRYYVNEYWKQVLSHLDPEKVYRDLDYSILLCYEPSAEFCHRHIVAAWFEILLNVKIPELEIKDHKIIEMERPEYIKEYLEDAMRTNRNMHGFNSLRALYLFEQSENLGKKAEDKEKKTGQNCDNYRQGACYLRCEADIAEEEYNELKRNMVLNKTKK